MSRILAVDDEQMITEIIKDLLERVGHEVYVANNGREAIERVEKEAFDLFITDISMPEMDGYQFIAEVKKIQPLAVIIVLTGYSSIDGAIKAVNSGAYKYLTKPVRAKDLYEVVKDGLKKSLLDFSSFDDSYYQTSESIFQSEPIIFKKFSPDQKIDFYKIGILRKYGLGDNIEMDYLSRGAIYLVESGKVSVWLNNKKIDTLLKFDTWGEETFMMAGKLPVKMVAEDNCQINIFERKKLLTHFAENEETLLKRFIFNISAAIFYKYRKSAERIMMMQIGKNN